MIRTVTTFAWISQSAIMWRKVIPLIKDKFSIVCPDLRGYGYSEKPITGYDKKTMASDMFELMKHLVTRILLLVMTGGKLRTD